MGIQLNKGFSLIEVMIASMLLLTGSVALLSFHRAYADFISLHMKTLTAQSVEAEALIENKISWDQISVDTTKRVHAPKKVQVNLAAINNHYPIKKEVISWQFIDSDGDSIDDKWITVNGKTIIRPGSGIFTQSIAQIVLDEKAEDEESVIKSIQAYVRYSN